MSRRLLSPVFVVSAVFLLGTLAFALAGIVDRLS